LPATTRGHHTKDDATLTIPVRVLHSSTTHLHASCCRQHGLMQSVQQPASLLGSTASMALSSFQFPSNASLLLLHSSTLSFISFSSQLYTALHRFSYLLDAVSNRGNRRYHLTTHGVTLSRTSNTGIPVSSTVARPPFCTILLVHRRAARAVHQVWGFVR
jgi:hypothetical protein